jgi:hypothetical protein
MNGNVLSTARLLLDKEFCALAHYRLRHKFSFVDCFYSSINFILFYFILEFDKILIGAIPLCIQYSIKQYLPTDKDIYYVFFNYKLYPSYFLNLHS